MASRSLGTLTLDLVAKTGGFTGPLSQAERQSQKSMGNIADSATSAAATFAASVAAMGASVGTLLVSAANNAAELERMAYLSNSGTEEFQRMAAAAARVGIEQDKLSDILKDTNDRIGDFITTGGGAMTDFFEKVAPKIGITAAAFANLSGPQAILLFAESLEKANVSQAEFVFQMEGLASDATALGPLLANGGKRLLEYAKQADQLGIISSELETFQFARASEGMDLFGQAIEGAGNKLATSLLPQVNEFTNWIQSPEAIAGIGELTDNITYLIDAAELLAVVFGSRVVGSLVATGTSLAAAQIQAMRYQAALASMAGVSRTAALGIAAVGTAARAASGAMALLGGPVGAAITAGAALYYFASQSSAAEKAADALNNRVTMLASNIDRMTQKQAVAAVGDFETRLGNTRSEISATDKAIAELQSRMGRSMGPRGGGGTEAGRQARLKELEQQRLRLDAQLEEDQKNLESVRKRAATANANVDPAALSKYNDLLDKLKEESALRSDATELQKVEYAIKNKLLGALTTAQEDELKKYAKSADAQKAKEDAEKEAASATKASAAEIARNAAAIQSQIDTLVEQAVTYGMSERELALFKLTQAGATAEQIKSADAILKEIELRKEVASAVASQAEQTRWLAALNEELAATQSSIELEVRGVGMGDRERQQMEQEIAIRKKYAQQRRELAEQSFGDLSGSALEDQKRLRDERIQKLTEAEVKEIALVQEGARLKAEAESDWMNGATRAWENYQRNIQDVAGQTEALFENAFQGMGDLLVDFTTTGKADLDSFASSVLVSFARIQAAEGLINLSNLAFSKENKAALASFFGFGDATGSGLKTATETAEATATAATLANGIVTGGTAAAPTLAAGMETGGITSAASLSAGIIEGSVAGSALFSQAIITAASAAALEIAAACAMCSCGGAGAAATAGASGGLGGVLGSLGGLFGGGGSAGGTGSASIGALEFNAKGNVYDSPSLSNYSGQIVSNPTLFAFAKGGVPNLGVFGEAGAEAIMPLGRTSSGDLGVKASIPNIDWKQPEAKPPIVNIIEDSSRAGQVASRRQEDQYIIDVVINSLHGGQIERTMGRRFGTKVKGS